MDKKELMRYEEIVENLLLFYGDIIRKEEKKYRTLFDNASDAIIIADLNGKFIDVNKKAEKLTGYSREELLDLVVGDLSPIEDVYINSKVFRDGFEAGHLTHIGAKILRKDKTLVPVDITASVIEYGGKRVMQGIFRDMRERERLEQQIIESRLMFRTLFDSMDDYISLHDNDGVLKMANKSLANSVNLPVREILGKKCEDIYRCGQKDENCAIGRSIKTMKQEFSEVAVDRSIFHVWVYPMINRNGELEGVIQHRKNVTEYKLMEKEIFQLQKIAELGNMAGGIAHEIRNPLNTISSALYLMKKAAGKSNIKADSYLN